MGNCVNCNESSTGGLSKQEILDLINSYGGIPIGAELFIDKPQLRYFDQTGRGLVGDRWEGWAIQNGNNGTTNLAGRFFVCHDPQDGEFMYLATGGYKYVTLATNQIPSHDHGLSKAEHSHTIPSLSHTHLATSGNALGSTSISAAGDELAPVTGTVTLTGGNSYVTWERIGVTAGTDEIEVFVHAASDPGLVIATDDENFGFTGTASIGTHTHDALNLTHNHTVSVSASAELLYTTGITEITQNTDLTGDGEPHSNLPPYVVKIPVIKIY